MILESKKIFLKKVYIYSDDPFLKQSYMDGKYSAINATSYNKLPDDFLSLYKRRGSFMVRQKQITCIDLKLDSDEIFNRFNDTAKKHVRRALKNSDLSFSHAKKPVNDESYGVYKNFEYSQGRVPISKGEFTKYRLFSASYKGEQISGISLVESHPYIRTITIYSKRLSVEDKEMYKIIAQASRAIVWQICLWAKKEGFIIFDLGSINTVDLAKAGITDFKLSFGGDVMPEYTYIYKSKIFSFFEKFVFIKNFIKNIFKI